MNKTVAAIVIASFALFAGQAFAANADCEAKATEKKLAGAAKTSFVKKCEKDAAPAAAAAPAASPACEAKAVDKNGKALAGAAKTSSIKKCMAAEKAPAKK